MKEAEKLKTFLWIAITALITVTMLCVWSLIKWRKEKKITAETTSKIIAVETAHKMQLHTKDNCINSYSRELTSHALQLAQINELTNEILSITAAKDESASIRLRKIQDRIKQYELQDNMWQLFKIYFEQTHPDFFKALYRSHPDLSPNEIRMCAYIMMNLTTKEIASLTNRSARTVETVKYRLHKKLSLDEESTASYLNRLTTDTPSKP